MRFQTLPLLLSFVGCTVSTTMLKSAELWTCGTLSPSTQQVAQQKEIIALERLKRRESQAGINIDVYLHVIAKSKNASDGYLTNRTIHAQLDQVNKDFAPAHISFTLKGIDKTIANWSDGYEGAEEVKDALRLRKGDFSALNLYFLGQLSDELVGYGSYPWMKNYTGDFHHDGCTIRHDTVPGGTHMNSNTGKTTTHEIGHWLGLLHPFDNTKQSDTHGCIGIGDGVDDTPAMASRSFGCPIGRDSCPDQPGLDPIHNYMDYTNDACKTEFTPQQIERMRAMWFKYRAPQDVMNGRIK